MKLFLPCCLVVIGFYEIQSEFEVTYPGRIRLKVNRVKQELCYDGYITSNVIEHLVDLEPAGQTSRDSTLEVYWMTGDYRRRKLVCVFDWLSGSNVQGMCQGRVKNATLSQYQLLIELRVMPDMNNAQLILLVRIPETPWNPIYDKVITVQPLPQLKITIGGKRMDTEHCNTEAIIGREMLVEFCADFLKSPTLQIYLFRQPSGDGMKGKCTQKSFMVTSLSFEIHMTYADDCCQFGSVTCRIKGVNRLSSSTISVSSLFTFNVLTGEMMFISGVLVILAVIYVANKRYHHLKKVSKIKKKHILKEKKRAEKRQKLENLRKDPNYAGAIFEVFTADESDTDSSDSS